MSITFIGDVHGKLEQYKQIIDNCKFSVCVGDFGFKKEWDWYRKNIDQSYHLINPGNHDFIPYIHTVDGCTGNFYCNYRRSYMTIRGAESIDKHLRQEGVDWFTNEELNYTEQLEAFDRYSQFKPKIMVTHDCPQVVMEQLFGYPEKSQTRTMLQHMFEFHQPDLWVFGHHHKSKDVVINGTRFVCLAELETLTIEI